MDCNKTDCIHYKVCEEWKSLGNDNYINESNGNCDCYSAPYNPTGDTISRSDLQGEYKTSCNVLLSLEQIVRSSDGWEDSAVEAVHNAVQTAIKCMHDRPQGEWIYHEEPDYSTEDDCIVYYQCSVCGRKIYSSTVNEKDYPFCHCGADMRGEENE